MIESLEQFTQAFIEIKRMGWIRTHRAGPTGIGKTLEDLLGIPENNADAPDFGEYELKSGRIDSASMLTLFTKTPRPARVNTALRMRYGYSSDAYTNDEKVLHTTLSAARFVPIHNTGHEMKISCYPDKISIESEYEADIAYWNRDELRRAFQKKYKNKLVYAKAKARGFGAGEEFKFVEAWAVSGFDYDSLITLLEEGKIFIDLRIGQYPNGKTHDHGTAFRIRDCDQYLLFGDRILLA